MNITFNSHKSTEDYYFDKCCIWKYNGVCETESITLSSLLKTWMHTWKSDHFHILSQKWFSYTNFEQQSNIWWLWAWMCTTVSLWICLNIGQNNKQAIWKCLYYHTNCLYTIMWWDETKNNHLTNYRIYLKRTL